MQLSAVDTVYRSVLLTKFFTNGWGNPQYMKRIFTFRKKISNRETCKKLVDRNHPIYIDKIVETNSDCSVIEGHFLTPLYQYMPDLIPEEVKVAKFQMVLPRKWRHEFLKPICLHLAGTGDHFFWRRKTLMAKPLLRESGIASIILENPFYGSRKPPDQKRSSLKNVSDIFIMGGCLILESLALFHFCERMNFAPLCITGISMGGHNASLAGTNWHKPLSIVPCLSWTTASCVFTQGVMSGAIPWGVLENQYDSFGEEFRKEVKEMIHSPEDNSAFNAGRQFAKDISSNIDGFVNFQLFKTLKSKSFSSEKKDALNFMRGIMDECTHLGNFSTPVDPELAIIVTASKDGYVPREGLIPLTSLWKGSTQRLLDSGHIAAVLFKLDFFRYVQNCFSSEKIF
ncbi:C4orf29-like protein [Dinothrombium tinctorium]|uniref:C4orf29-like protein n=2 Tax=Dinothrombium tinctorium TaxID=1965070 RepID=A0A3S3QMD6_9ACAR|nr:C4orf29-like protein [Dinothrombium tinctorium]RWS11644.1 C4orf29-like protein [Dinothrombium tinctorium]